EIKRLIIVDTKNLDRLGVFRDFVSKHKPKIHIYDHHPITKQDIKGELEVIVPVGAVSTIFTEIFEKKSIAITPMEATIITLGIYEETGSLLYSSTTPRDLNAVSYLLKRGADLNIVASFMRADITAEEFGLLNRLLETAEELIIMGSHIFICMAVTEGYSDVAHLAHRLIDMLNADAVFIIVMLSDKVLIVGRSKTPQIDTSSILSVFGGGGHVFASSATIHEVPLEIVQERLINSINQNIKPIKTAKDVMTTPVITINHNDTIKNAEMMMTRYGVNVLPIIQSEQYSGIITRETVEKALFHGFKNSPCKDFASTDVFVASKDTNITDIESAMVETNQRFVPVVEDNKVIGAITRTDLLRTMYAEALKRNSISSTPIPQKSGIIKNAKKLMKDRFPDEIYEILHIAGEIADKMGVSAYLVGGAVRDILRGEDNLDIDIVVEGDGILYAKELANRISARVSVYKRFGTARLLPIEEDKGLWAKNKELKIDVATARTEYYETPASLPKVETASIKKDLYRRDFTINTLAIRLNHQEFGVIIDYFGGQRDLKEKVIRTLHNLSFVEDPTRAFRAVRFSERFGFKISRHTENLIKTAVRMNIFDKLSGTRIYDELTLTFKETNPVKALQSMDRYGLLKVIHPSIRLTKEMLQLLESVNETVIWYNLLYLQGKCKSHMLYIMALLYKLSDDERTQALKRLSVNAYETGQIFKMYASAQAILSRLNPSDDYAIYQLLKNQPIEALLFAMAVTKNEERKKAISMFLLKLNNIKPVITGNDLKDLGISEGPIYKTILNKIVEGRIKGLISTKEDEIRVARLYAEGKEI
ncbi:MAG: CBS domain-containing protein, partial [Thermodesulfovibrionales bacterium]|nr:CBS domain-containing protein [Thermodesulfovibrionales bacterium]